ncbi:hypothetical protein AJ80_02883 [Polytolypa hystricis UAMH7299]|uniref:Mis12-Mtw1 family protein n=1 Tax=Polytolypa hystricis (strain UAMH7299) TaxID=1447883 RepID=A0A2B7YPZ6_POLH7|nr:hypothetical protein AJ80_02883 [Polytolypa hystricis UAMH7299]
MSTALATTRNATIITTHHQHHDYYSTGGRSSNSRAPRRSIFDFDEAVAAEVTRRDPLRSLDNTVMPPARGRSKAAAAAVISGTENGGGGSVKKVKRTNARLVEGSGDEGAGMNGWTGKSAGAGKRKAVEYDEDIEGFQFSRATQSKKPKPTAAGHNLRESTISEEPAAEKQPARRPRGRPPKTSEVPRNVVSTLNGQAATRPQRRTSKRLAEESPLIQASMNSRSRRKKSPDVEPAPITVHKKRGAAKSGEPRSAAIQESDERGSQTPKPQTIALPFADTPVMRKNKEMRMEKGKKGQRRSSLGMRGRRASSLIDSGASNALPHDAVDNADFYKHIESEGLSEPRRMRQLLIWCATRAMGDKPSGSRSEDESARLAARVLQEEILKEIGNRSELSDWFSREESTPPAVVVKKPNPKNIQNGEKIKELEEQIQKLQAERQSLASLLRPPSIPRIRPEPQSESREPNPSTSIPPPSSSSSSSEPIDASLLDPSQQPILNTLLNTSNSNNDNTSTTPDSAAHEPTSTSSISAISARLSRLTTSLAPTLDTFAAGMHNIELFCGSADRVAGQVLAICAARLDERDRIRRVVEEGEEEGEEDDDEDADSGEKIKTRRKRHGDEEGVGGGGGRRVLVEKEDLGVVLSALSRIERR